MPAFFFGTSLPEQVGDRFSSRRESLQRRPRPGLVCPAASRIDPIMYSTSSSGRSSLKRSSIVFNTVGLSSLGAVSTVPMPMIRSQVQRLSVGSGCRSKTVPSSISTAGWTSASNGIFRTACRQTARLAKERSGLFFSRANASLCRIVLETLSFLLKCRRKEGTVSLGKQPPEECLPELSPLCETDF